MKIKIDKEVPISKKKTGAAGKYTEAFRMMEIGDSFMVEKFNQSETARMRAKKLGYVVTTRKQQDGSYRVWRVK